MLKLGFTQNDWARLSADEKKIFAQDSTLEAVRGAEIPAGCAFTMAHAESGWILRAAGEDWAPLHVDFRSKNWMQRTRDPLKWRDPLVKACGVTPKSKGLSLLDLTAGLGSDSKMLHELGVEITAFERSAPLYMLLSDALKRAAATDSFKLVFGSFVPQDWPKYKTNIIYLDPMFPPEKKKALPPREMQYLRRLLGEPNEGYFSLLETALKTPASRVVMKSALKGPVFPGRSFTVAGKSHRFDVFVRVS